MVPSRSTAHSSARVITEAARYAFDRIAPSVEAIPDRPTAISPRWLERLLEAPSGSIRSVEVADEHHGTASRARLVLCTNGNAKLPSHAFVKLAPRTFTGRLFMNVMRLGVREALFYRELAPEIPVRVPHCYASAVDDRRGRNAILLEDLSAKCRFRDITDPCSSGEALAVVEALGDLHARYWASPRFSSDLCPFVQRADDPAVVLGAKLVRRVLERPNGMVGQLVPAETQQASRVLIAHSDGIAAFWAGVPQTLTHNDTHLGNLFFDGAVPGFLDWQNAGAGPGIRDVAYFVLPSLPPELARATERDLIRAYVDRLASNGVAADEHQTWTHYRAAASQFYIGAIVTGAFGGRLQRAHIARVGIERAVAAVRDLDTFELLRELAVNRPV